MRPNVPNLHYVIRSAFQHKTYQNKKVHQKILRNLSTPNLAMSVKKGINIPSSGGKFARQATIQANEPRDKKLTGKRKVLWHQI